MTARSTSGKVANQTTFVEKDAKGAPVKDIAWQASQIEAQSDTKLEDDTGYGKAIVIRMFEFAINPNGWPNKPTKQELFNAHLHGIEVMLWRDGLKVMTDVEPRLSIGKKKYRIWVAAEPARGHLLNETPKTLSQLAANHHG